VQRTLAEKIFGIARLDGVIYVLCDQSMRVLAFSADTYQRLPDVDVVLTELQHPSDMVACLLYQRLYIAECDDSNPGCVWQVDWLGRASNLSSADHLLSF